MNLMSLINQYASTAYDANNLEEVVTILNTPSVTMRDDSLYTWAGVALLAGPEAAEQLRVALEQNGMGWAVHQFGGAGLQMTNPLVRAAIQQFIAVGINLQALLDATEYQTSPSQLALGREVTLEEVSALKLYNFRKNLKSQADLLFSQKKAEFYRVIDSWDDQNNPPTIEFIINNE